MGCSRAEPFPAVPVTSQLARNKNMGSCGFATEQINGLGGNPGRAKQQGLSILLELSIQD